MSRSTPTVAAGPDQGTDPASAARSRGALVGLLLGAAVTLTALTLPTLVGWGVHPFVGPHGVEPLHSHWRPHVGPGSLPAVLLGALGVAYAAPYARRLGWGRLLAAAYLLGLAWLVSLALVDGVGGLGDVLGEPFEYVREAGRVDDVGLLLREWVERVSFDSDRTLAANVAGHPPFLFLVFVLLERLGLAPAPASGLIVVAIAATAPLAVLVTVRRLVGEDVARTVAPFLVLTPMAVFVGVSADALILTAGTWGLCLLALAATSGGRRGAALSVASGLVLGSTVMLSYGALLLGVVALAVLWSARTWWPLPVAALAALVPVLVLAPFGFYVWDAYVALGDRYWAGIARHRPPSYWVWGNVGALVLSAGPALGAGLGALAVAVRLRVAGRRSPDQTSTAAPVDDVRRRALVALPVGGLLAVVAADASLMSLSEVERIWLPFMPWMLLALVLVPPRRHQQLLVLQVVTALALPHLLDTHW